MIVALSAKNKMGFIDGSIQKTLLADPLYAAWHCCNNMIIAWFLNIANSVLSMRTAKEI